MNLEDNIALLVDDYYMISKNDYDYNVIVEYFGYCIYGISREVAVVRQLSGDEIFTREEMVEFVETTFAKEVLSKYITQGSVGTLSMKPFCDFINEHVMPTRNTTPRIP